MTRIDHRKGNMQMTTISELCNANGLNAKVVRAKLRRAVKSGELKISHDHRSNWAVNPAILSFLGLGLKPKKSTAPKKSAAKKAA
jgi:hypothetical protein